MGVDHLISQCCTVGALQCCFCAQQGTAVFFDTQNVIKSCLLNGVSYGKEEAKKKKTVFFYTILYSLISMCSIPNTKKQNKTKATLVLVVFVSFDRLYISITYTLHCCTRYPQTHGIYASSRVLRL